MKTRVISEWRTEVWDVRVDEARKEGWTPLGETFRVVVDGEHI